MPRQRGQRQFSGESVVRGLRLEPDLVRDLRAYAVKQAKDHDIRDPKTKELKPNMASAARHLIRIGLGIDREHASAPARAPASRRT